LNKALDSKEQGIPKELFRRALGICLIQVVEAGFIFSGSVGTGILLKKRADGSWSKPCAMGLGGVGWGVVFGGAVKDVMIFILDENSMKGMMGVTGLRVGGQLNLTPGPFGRNYDAGIGVSNKGAMGTVSVAFSQGLLMSISLQGAIVGVRGGANERFYGAVTNPHSIIETDDVCFPEDKPTLIDSVYEKLEMLAKEETADQIDQQEVAKATAYADAEKAKREVTEGG
jgi:lipid-binding SYLF domain-containing protein